MVKTSRDIYFGLFLGQTSQDVGELYGRWVPFHQAAGVPLTSWGRKWTTSRTVVHHLHK
jgi:hypothetical protein